MMNTKNNLILLQNLELEVCQFIKYLKDKYIKYVEENCRKTKTYYIFKNEKKSSLFNSQKVFKEFLKTVDIEKYKQINKLSSSYFSFFYFNNDCKIDFNIFKEPKHIKLISNFDRPIGASEDELDFSVFRSFLYLLGELRYDMTLRDDEMTYEQKVKVEKINDIIGIIHKTNNLI